MGHRKYVVARRDSRTFEVWAEHHNEPGVFTTKVASCSSLQDAKDVRDALNKS